MPHPLDFSGKAVIVTGGCRGIGRGIAERFLQAGADVVICCRHQPETRPEADGREAVFVTADVRDPDECERVVDVAVERFGRLDVVVNNAGGAPPAEAATASPRFSEAVVRLNLLGPLHMAQHANAVMQKQPDGGAIINIGSISGMRPSPGASAYGAAKAGLINLTQTLAMEWAPKVRVNSVTPGLVRTEDAEAHYGDEQAQRAVAATVPVGRMANPTEIADACLFLASDLSGFTTGANLVLHGGGERPPYLDAVDRG
ncbi:MAG TPA: SDR family oxidoreductase [Acidimicrobiales bacterium]|nr:SDR family oxidoreductase [Acidimicrobiales bacterium]